MIIPFLITNKVLILINKFFFNFILNSITATALITFGNKRKFFMMLFLTFSTLIPASYLLVGAPLKLPFENDRKLTMFSYFF